MSIRFGDWSRLGASGRWRAIALRARRAPGESISALLLLATLAARAGEASAHDQPGSLGAAASATDYYRVSCIDDGAGTPVSLTLSVRDSAPSDAQRVSVQVEVAGVVTNTTDMNDADALYSPTIALNGGLATYHVLVDKNVAGGETYQFAFHCWTGPDGTGLHTGTSITAVQSQ